MKDFDSFMPGHGGMMDRMDCQLLMIFFTSFYYFRFIAPKSFTGIYDNYYYSVVVAVVAVVVVVV